MPIHDWAHMTVPTHVCAQTWLCPRTFDLLPDMILPSHVCAHTRLCPDTFVPTHVCAHTRLCPDTFVPTHVCVQTRLCPDTIMSLVNNNIIIVSIRLIMCQFDWWKHKHAQLLLSWHMLLLSQGTKYVSGHKLHVGFCPDMIVTTRYYNMSVLKCVWAQTCLGTIVLVQVCMGTNVWSPINNIVFL